MRSLIICTLGLMAVACGDTSEQDAPADSTPAVAVASGYPVVTEEACQGEACMAAYDAVPCRGIALVAGPRRPDIVGALTPRDTVSVRSDLHLMQPGRVVMKRDVSVPDEWNSGTRVAPALHFAARDTLLLLRYIGEGFWLGSYRGRSMEVQEFWGGPQPPRSAEDSAQAEDAVGTWPVIETWLRISRGGQVIGWWKDTSSTRTLRPIGEYGEQGEFGC